MKNSVKLVHLIISTTLAAASCAVGEFVSLADTNRELGIRFRTVANVFSNDEIVAIAGDCRVYLRKVEDLRPVGEVDPFYGRYIVSNDKVAIGRDVFSRLLSERDLGVQVLGVVKVNAVLEIHTEERKFLILLVIPKEKNVAGWLHGSWSYSPDLAQALRSAWESRSTASVSKE